MPRGIAIIPSPLEKEKGKEGHFHFNNPMGIGYSEGKRILAIADYENKRIEIFIVRREGCDHHSIINFPAKFIAISTPGDLILFSAYNNDVGNDTYSVFIYLVEGRRI